MPAHLSDRILSNFCAFTFNFLAWKLFRTLLDMPYSWKKLIINFSGQLSGLNCILFWRISTFWRNFATLTFYQNWYFIAHSKAIDVFELSAAFSGPLYFSHLKDSLSIVTRKQHFDLVFCKRYKKLDEIEEIEENFVIGSLSINASNIKTALKVRVF